MPATTQTVSIDGRRLRLSNLEKVLYPATGTTKADVLAYYAEIAPYMLPHCAGRPATRKRWPDGVGTDDEPGAVFFIKNLEAGAPEWVVRADIEHSSGPKTYPLVDNPATLAWLAQVAALEIHVPQWRFAHDGTRHNPDRMVLDLDPGEGAGLAECAEVARWARDLLRGMGLEPVPVTSGSKGIHLYAALDGTHTSDEISAIAHELARALEADHGDLVVSDMRKTLRAGKVLVDWSQNNGSKTTVAPYSLRGRTRPTVAAPRTWRELASPTLRHLELAEVLDRARRRGDPMAAMFPARDGEFGQGVPGHDFLGTYRSMRNPGRTPEPVPDAVAPTTGATQTFVIQEHHARRWHLDFRLAHDGVLVSWALPRGVPTDPAQNHLAVQTEDHPMEYGSFAGTIPEGEYGAGEVRIFDSGTYEYDKWHEGKEVIVSLTGQEGGGLETDGPGRTARLALIHTGGRGGQEPRSWLIHLMADGRRAAPSTEAPSTATAAQGTAAQGTAPRGTAPRGIASKGTAPRSPVSRSPRAAPGPAGSTSPRAASRAARRDVPSPMLATAGDVGDLSAGHDWALEMKWDGARAVVVVEGDDVRLLSRNGNDVTKLYPELADVAGCLTGAGEAVLDGEIVALDRRGRPSFSLLQQRFNLVRPRDIERARASAPVHLMLFDLLEADGESYLRRTYDERRALLRELVDASADSRVEVPEAFDGDVDAAMAASRAWGLEGVVAKRRDSAYTPGRRSGAWVKIKHTLSQEVVVVGWRPGQGNRSGAVGSLLVAVPGDDGELRYAGRVGTGFTQREARTWAEELSRQERRTPPVADVPRPDAKDARWVTANRVAEVELSEWTGEGRLRHPRWRGWRPDKEPADVVVESR
ncbi:ATP-dependent DNA ligase [Georgenia muralis]|uniref:DNA ligase (ATP) n=1 Tax=Georgenia muralis TaxID=154117 RepID=A0A3N4Z700_9MICO|nr:ATP-dependent DNA ligase [Georgenia muralis]RPF29179.1 ATP-dependent DNA ligase LigD ligase module /ATP-dependent DNA ligase LigD phosphoesterase module /ATP-dependent DNA ligase LigD polymerase module [Georgenia muralis]